MAVCLRVLANPRVLKRFMGTRAGKKAALKYGSMLLNSKMARDAVGKFMNRSGGAMTGNRDFAKMEREYARLERRVEKLETQLDAVRNNDEKISELTFTLGRNVVEMQQLLKKMQAEYQQEIRKVSVLQYAQKLR